MLPTTRESELVSPQYKARAKSWTTFDTAPAQDIRVTPLARSLTQGGTLNDSSAGAPPRSMSTAQMYCCPEPECFRKFNRRYTLAEHMKTHSGEKPHICPAAGCRKRFSTSGNLSRHKRLHGFIKPLECPVDGCRSTFPSNNKLEKHMQYHLGSPVHVCTIGTCGKTFSTMGNLNRHVKQQHPHESDQHEVGASRSSFVSPSSSSSSNQSRRRGFSAPTMRYPSQSPTAADDLYGSGAATSSNAVFAQRSQGQQLHCASATPFPRMYPATGSAMGQPERAWSNDTLLDSLATIFDDDAALPSLPACAPHIEHVQLQKHHAYAPLDHSQMQMQHHHPLSFDNHDAPAPLELAFAQRASLLDDMIHFHVTNFQC